ncbi:glucosamine-6-phosphate deaminase [Spiroplasma cantharicola]|uniref:Glucosamine-6-phosphate deaminase n=1 Tax=Spiroplasma cantharicola TaxID=362837 RepID=A0A0M3SJB3_9MOLU|nr:glucosamine-6-phosphate deaminase [Spiroplasma cantharicola]ALD66434.1 glucosamine-6-phosphate deaminase [Spiroplasma cantharicola]
MRVITTKNYEDMSNKALELFIDIINKDEHKKRINVALTGGKTPLLFYKKLISNLDKINELERIHFYNFDEIPYKNDLSKGITIDDLERIFYSLTKIDEGNIHKMNILNWKEHIKQLETDGGLDLVLLGIGIDGHFCGNLSGVTKFGDKTRLIKNKDLENNISVPKLDNNLFHDEYVTMGPREIMATKNIIMIANGENKAEIIDQLLNGPVVEDIPSTILTLHPYFNLIIDEDANKIAKK